MTAIEVTNGTEIAIEAEIRTEVEMTAEMEDLAMTDSVRIQEIDSKKKGRDRKIGMTRIGTEDRTVRGHTTHIKRTIAGNV